MTARRRTRYVAASPRRRQPPRQRPSPPLPIRTLFERDVALAKVDLAVLVRERLGLRVGRADRVQLQTALDGECLERHRRLRHRRRRRGHGF